MDVDHSGLKSFNSKLFDAIPHGFFTRFGGYSKGIYKGLNCGRGSADKASNVEANRQAVTNYFGKKSDSLLSVHQHHSSDVLTVNAPNNETPKADAMVTAQTGLILSILTADCQPVLFYDGSAKVIGAAHAGSKGTKAGILQNTITAMEAVGAKRKNIKVVIGPCISQNAYETGPDFFNEICSDDPDAKRFFVQGKEDRFQFDLPGYSLEILRSENILQAEWIGHCTYADPLKFFSYRRSVHQKNTDYGRLISCISL